VACALLLVTAVAGCSAGDDDDDDAAPASTTAAVTLAPTTTRAPRTTVPDPVAAVTGPVEGGSRGVPFNPMPPALADQHGYVEAEYFVAGNATAYAPDGALSVDGAGRVQPPTTAPYTTRIIVRRPVDPARFNGTVVVEWLNVTSGMDSDPDFGQGHAELLRNGYAYVGVSAQIVGVEGGSARIEIDGLDVLPLKEWDQQRYAALDHPGDDYSFDIFTQVAQILRAPGAVDPLGGLEPEQLLAAGESQSASRMVTYLNAVQPQARVYDGFLVHSRGRGAAPLGADPSATPGAGTRIRTDLDVPVLVLQTETDILRLGSFAARQPDTPRLRTWEVAGTAHADATTLAYGLASGAVWNPGGAVDFGDICGSVNDGHQTYVVRQAIAALTAWARGGTAPATATPIEVRDGAIVRDGLGLALGGIRTPAVDVPIASLTGEAPADRSVLCSLFGASTPLQAQVLAARYPTHAGYVAEVEAAARAAVDAGFVADADVAEIVATAQAAPVPA
jgi:Alpha/beta hydrolase domain